MVLYDEPLVLLARERCDADVTLDHQINLTLLTTDAARASCTIVTTVAARISAGHGTKPRGIGHTDPDAVASSSGS